VVMCFDLCVWFGASCVWFMLVTLFLVFFPVPELVSLLPFCVFAALSGSVASPACSFPLVGL
jgi:hypothetical protein